MTRFSSAQNQAEADQPSITMVVLVKMDFDSGPVQLHDGVGILSFYGQLLKEDGFDLLLENGDNITLEFTGGILETESGVIITTENEIELTTSTLPQIYYGAGEFGSIDVVEESIEVIARSIRLSLSGVDANLVSKVMTENYQNRNVTISLGFLRIDNYDFIDTPEILWEGRMNQMSIDIAKGRANILLSCEHRLRREPRTGRYTDEDQDVIFPGDEFFNLMHTIPGFIGKWGARDAAYGGGVPSDFDNPPVNER